MGNKKPENLRQLIEQHYASPALLPEKNDYILSGGKIDFDKLEKLSGYTIPLVAHDYAAKTPVMWNSLYEKLGLNIRNILLVANPENIKIITDAFRADPKYLGGGFGVGFKEKLEFLDEIRPGDLRAVNIVVKEEGRLIGYNTDALGFVKSLEDKLSGFDKTIAGGVFTLVGAGGVAKEVARLLAEKGAFYIAIANRTVQKAVKLAGWLNDNYSGVNAYGTPENLIRGIALNAELPPDAIINLSNKGDDSLPNATMFYGTHDIETGKKIQRAQIEHISRGTIRYAISQNPDMIYADITLPSSGISKSLAFARAELGKEFEDEDVEKRIEEVEKRILDGIPMVINQAVPAYVYVQNAHPEIHTKKISEEEILEVFRQAAD